MLRWERPVLAVDDDDDDRFLLRRAWEEAGVRNPLLEAAGGAEAISRLSRAGPSPCLVLLDLKMPGVSGFDVLEWRRSNPGLCPAPVIMLTASTAPHDVEEAFRRGAASFLVKPSSLEELVRAVGVLDRWWLQLSELPAPRDRPAP